MGILVGTLCQSTRLCFLLSFPSPTGSEIGNFPAFFVDWKELLGLVILSASTGGGQTGLPPAKPSTIPRHSPLSFSGKHAVKFSNNTPRAAAEAACGQGSGGHWLIAHCSNNARIYGGLLLPPETFWKNTGEPFQISTFSEPFSASRA